MILITEVFFSGSVQSLTGDRKQLVTERSWGNFSFGVTFFKTAFKRISHPPPPPDNLGSH